MKSALLFFAAGLGCLGAILFSHAADKASSASSKGSGSASASGSSSGASSAGSSSASSSGSSKSSGSVEKFSTLLKDVPCRVESWNKDGRALVLEEMTVDVNVARDVYNLEKAISDTLYDK